MTTKRRVSLSLRYEQVLWLSELLARLRRGSDVADVSIILRSAEANNAVRIIQSAMHRARNASSIPKRGIQCPNGHAYTPETTIKTACGHRRCTICHKAMCKRRQEARNRRNRAAREAAAALEERRSA